MSTTSRLLVGLTRASRRSRRSFHAAPSLRSGGTGSKSYNGGAHSSISGTTPTPTPIRLDPSSASRCFSSSNAPSREQQSPAPSASTTVTTEPYQSYEYPWATEPPEITRSVATKDGGVRVSTVIDQQKPHSNQVHPKADGAAVAGSKGSGEKAWFPFSGIFSKSKPTNETSDDEASVISTSTTTSTTSSTSEESSDSETTTTTTATSTEISESLQESIRSYNDPFDDTHTLTDEERAQKVAQQKQQISTSLSAQLQPVQTTQPSYIPLATPASELPTPETIITTLDNGVRIVSQETYAQVSTVGVVSELGSRYETPGVNTGVTNLLELLAFGAVNNSEEYPDAPAIAHTLQDWGATRFVSAGREQSIHCVDILRPNVAKAVHLLAQTLCHPAFPEAEVEEAKQAISFQSLPDVTPPELFLQEALQRGAYGSNQQLGQPHFCPPSMLDKLTRQTCLDYWKTQFLSNPQGLVVGGAGVDHDQLVKLVEDNFGHLQQSKENRVPLQVSQYHGGYADFQIPPPPDYDATISGADLSAADQDKRLTRVAVALETGGWHAQNDLVAACVLQTLLGGGSSFSAGGPGKGMYSRLYRQVLNAHHWAESAEAFTAFHSESGLLGIAGAAQPAHARDLVQVLSEHLCRLATQQVTDTELRRARNMLKCNVLTQLESRLVLFEDMARQVLTYGQRECIQQTCRKIDAVTASDVQRIAVQGLANGPPTLAAVGVDISNVPRYNELTAWFRANRVM